MTQDSAMQLGTCKKCKATGLGFFVCPSYTWRLCPACGWSESVESENLAQFLAERAKGENTDG